MLIQKEILSEITNKEINDKLKGVNRNPTQGQKEAGNYKMGHINVLGFDITIENPRGSYRKGVDKDGKEWKCKMYHHYGYFRRTKAIDGDAIDVFVGTNLKSEKIFVIDQVNNNGEFDESKVMLGFNSAKEAKEGYMSCYSKGWKGFKEITEIDIETFRKWLYNGTKRIKPFAEYKINESLEITNGDKGRGNFEKVISCNKCRRHAVYNLTLIKTGTQEGKDKTYIVNKDGQAPESANTGSIALYYCPACKSYSAIEK